MSTAAVKPYLRSKIHPMKFALYVGCGSVLMIFAALTSAYVVRHGAGNWLEFKMPSPFFYSTVIILLSSFTLHVAYKAYKTNKEKLFTPMLIISLFLSIAFLVLQYQGWLALAEIGLPLRTNASGDFVYALSWLHAAHVLGGVAAIIVATIMAFSAKFVFSEKRRLRLELTLTYWHFVDFLWVYIFLIFLLQ